jgi:hypothetical protein
MRWIVSVGTLALIGLVVGLGLGALFRVQAYLNHRAELHFEAQKGLPPTKVSATEHGPRSLDGGPMQSMAGEIERPTPAPAGAAAIPDVTGSTERNTVAAIRANEANPTTEVTRPPLPVVPRATLGEGQKAAEIEAAQPQNNERVPIRVNRGGAKPSIYMVPRE